MQNSAHKTVAKPIKRVANSGDLDQVDAHAQNHRRCRARVPARLARITRHRCEQFANRFRESDFNTAAHQVMTDIELHEVRHEVD